jgi:hypothetical protein
MRLMISMIKGLVICLDAMHCVAWSYVSFCKMKLGIKEVISCEVDHNKEHRITTAYFG